MSGPQIALGARVRKSPYFEATRRHGCRMYTIYNHMFLPVAYADSYDQNYVDATQKVQIWDVGCERQIEIAGPDAARFAQYLTPRDLSKLTPGRASYAPLVDHRGCVVNDPVCLKLSDTRFWFSLADSDGLLWARGLAGMGDYDVEVFEPDVSPLQLQGPKSFHVMKAVFGDWIEELKFYRFRQTELNGIPLVVARMGYSRELCYEMFLQDGSRGDELWNRLWEAGEQYGISPGAPLQSLRIEGGLLSYQTDVSLEHNPYEVGLGWTVNLDQTGDFAAREALSKIKAQGVNRQLVGVGLSGEPLASANEHFLQMFHGDTKVGHLTTSAWSPRLERNIGFAMLDKPHDAVGTVLDIVSGSQTWRATVEPLPFIQERGSPPV